MTGWSKRPSPSQGNRPANWRKIAQRQLRAFPLCASCEAKGKVVVATECDHIIPISKGGSHDLSNLQSLCSPCHALKTHNEARAARGLRPIDALKARVTIGLDGWPI